MKILTVAIPCYNSAAYMRKAIDHALMGGEDVEVLIIDDGSAKDNTFEIACEYEARFPEIVRAIHQENKGHGGAVNTGLREAKGLYYKVCDSDDWLDYDALQKVLEVLRKYAGSEEAPDALIANYIYDKVGAKNKKVMHYERSLPENCVFSWKDIKKPLGSSTYVLMHSLVYRTELLRESGMVLPEHTFYVDNIVAFVPLMYVKKLYYLNVPLYHYFIGRGDQSVNEEVMIGRIDQQIKVTKLMIDGYRGDLVRSKKQSDFVLHYLSIIMSVSSILLLRIGTKEALAMKRELWEYLKKKDPDVYHKIRYCALGKVLNLPGKTGRRIAVEGYHIAQRLYGFN